MHGVGSTFLFFFLLMSFILLSFLSSLLPHFLCLLFRLIELPGPSVVVLIKIYWSSWWYCFPFPSDYIFVSLVFQGVLNPMQGFLFTLAFYGWTGWKLDLKWKKSEIPWESISTSTAADNAYSLPSGNSVNFHDSKKTTVSPNHQTDEALGMLSEGNLPSDDRLTRNSPVYQGW